MDNKAPGTDPRAQGYDAAGGAEAKENFFTPRQKAKKGSVQRAGLRSAYRVGMWFSVGLLVFVMMPIYIAPFYVKYVAGNEWLQRAKKSVWQRRNEKDFDLYMTQRKNSWREWLGLKYYNIGGEENIGDIQTYRQEHQKQGGKSM